MKRILAIFLAAFMLFTLAACGDTGKTTSGSDKPNTSQADDSGKDGKGGKAWPAADYMPDGAAYAGGGEIVVIVDDVTGGHMIYVNGVTKKDFDAYVAQLESAGVSGKVTELDGGAYIYGGKKDSFFANLSYYGDNVRTTMDKVNGKIVDVEYNLHISLGVTN